MLSASGHLVQCSLCCSYKWLNSKTGWPTMNGNKMRWQWLRTVHHNGAERRIWATFSVAWLLLPHSLALVCLSLLEIPHTTDPGDVCLHKNTLLVSYTTTLRMFLFLWDPTIYLLRCFCQSFSSGYYLSCEVISCGASNTSSLEVVVNGNFYSPPTLKGNQINAPPYRV